MFTVTLYKFKKKPNSTARPGSALSRSFSCYALDNSSIIRPTLVLQYGTDDILKYNYAYIPSWGRYYFIDDVAVLEGGIYQLVLNVDVLATYRTDILSSSQYVLRSASSYNPNISDDLYTTRAVFTETKSTATAIIDGPGGGVIKNYFNDNYRDGHFILTVASANAVGGFTYYDLTYTQFRDVIYNLMSYVPDDFDDVSDGIAKSLMDPMQYIMSCRWYPIDINQGFHSSTKNLTFGSYTIELEDNVPFIFERGAHYYTNITLPKHPQAAARPYTKLAPYSQYLLVFEPFGSIPIDTTKVYDSATVRLDWYIDIFTGDAELTVTNANGSIIATSSANIGVTVPVAQITVDYVGGASSVIGGVVGTIANALTGNVGGAINSAVSGIGSATQAAMPQVQTKGSMGSFTTYLMGAPYITGYFTEQVDIDPVRYGRPLCEVKTLSTLSGFALCSESSITIEGTQEENTLITGYLNSGVYIE